MHVNVLLFAQVAELVGARRVSIELDERATVADALDRLAAEHAAIDELRPQLAVAVDEAYANGATPLAPDCTIALIPPVSGG